MAVEKTRDFDAKAVIEKLLSVRRLVRRLFAGAELARAIHIAVIGLFAGFVLLVISGQLKTMAGEIVAIWIVDGYLLGHTLLLARRHKPIFLFGSSMGMLIANLMGDETLYVA